MFKPQHAAALVARCSRARRFSAASRVSVGLYGQPAPTYVRPTPASGGGSQTHARPLYIALVSVSIACAAYGIYDFYSMLTLWPPELRGDLRAALRAKRKKDLVRAESYFTRALATAETMPDTKLDLLKRTGISIAMAEILPHVQAYDLLSAAHGRMSSYAELSAKERVRAIALAVRLAELAPGPDEQEHWTTRAVEDALRILKNGSIPARSDVNLDGLELPQWVQRTDVAVPLERLGTLYSNRGNVDYAVPLFLKAIDIMAAPSASAEDRCRGGQLMNNLAEVLVAQQPTPDRLNQARAWASKGLAVAEKACKQLKGEELQTCQRTCSVLLFNLGQLHQMSGDIPNALEFLKKAHTRAVDANFLQGAQQAAASVMRIQLAHTKVPAEAKSL